jgi:16S rRNA (cytosine1407-C5)-methyltransferase
MSRKKTRKIPEMNAPAAQAAALERFKPLLAPEDFDALLAELERPLFPALRRNPLKSRPEDVNAWAQRYGWDISAVPYCPDGYWLKSQAQTASLTLEHRMGQFYLQDAASMLPVELFEIDPQSRPLILDLAASPGGKTTHLTARSMDQGLVIANDSAPDRITALRIVLQTWGAANVAVTRFPAEKYGRWYPDTFDRILLDAPCSMQSLRSTDSHPMRPISPREQSTLSRRQTAMLTSALAALKPGGQIVYSTCTLAPEEDEAVLDEIFRQFPHAVQISPLQQRLPGPAPALQTAFGQRFDPQVSNAARLWPHRFGTSGFFSALLTKTDQIAATREEPPDRPLSLVGQYPLPENSAQTLSQQMADWYGLNLTAILADYQLELWQNAKGIFAVPSRYLQYFAGLPCQLLGLQVAEESPDGWQPAHEWVSRFGAEMKTGVIILDPAQAQSWLLGSDVDFSDSALSKPGNSLLIIKDADGRVLGRGKLQSGRIRNLLPRRMV